MNLIERLCDHLEFLGLGTCNTDETAGDLFWGILPDSPDRALAVMSVDSSYAALRGRSGFRMSGPWRWQRNWKGFLVS